MPLHSNSLNNERNGSSDWLSGGLYHHKTYIRRRYDSGSNVFCTQYPFAEWHQRLGSGAHADAIMDRIAHNSVVMGMGTRNMREVTSLSSEHITDEA